MKVPHRVTSDWSNIVTLVLLLAFVLALPAVVLAQGKVTLQNDGSRLITLPDSTQVMAADKALAGQAVPVTGPLPSGITLMVGLYAGTSSTSLALVGSVALNPVGGSGSSVPGQIVSTRVILPFPGGSLAYMQVRVWDARYSSYEAASGRGSYEGASPLFTMTPGTSIAYPGINNGGGTTWGAGPIIFGGWPLPYYVYIFAQPQSQQIPRDSPVTFSVGASITCGCEPLSYQWYFNGAAIPGATSSSYHLEHAQITDAGAYWVNVFWGPYNATSANAMLSVLVPPEITSAPSSQTAEIGDTVKFVANAASDRPLRYGWFVNGVTARGDFSTNSSLRLTNVQFSDSGAYTVVVTNIAGAVTSPPAMLNVITPVQRRPVPSLVLLGAPGTQLRLDRSSVIAPSPNWASFDTVLLTNSAQWYFDVTESVAAQRFYRAWHTNLSAPMPTLQPYLVPALTLTGAAGASIRIDYINRTGPTDAWTALSTVTLTNSSQYYFDTSALCQPPRLYRVQSTP